MGEKKNSSWNLCIVFLPVFKLFGDFFTAIAELGSWLHHKPINPLKPVTHSCELDRLGRVSFLLFEPHHENLQRGKKGSPSAGIEPFQMYI